MEGLERVVVWVRSDGRKWEGPEVSGVAVAPEESSNSFIQRFFGCLPCEVRFWELGRHRSVGLDFDLEEIMVDESGIRLWGKISWHGYKPRLWGSRQETGNIPDGGKC